MPETLSAVAATVSESLGFATVVMNVYRPDSNDYEVVAVQGSSTARDLLLGRVTGADTWLPYLNERYRRHGVFWIPAGSVALDPEDITWYRPEIAVDGPVDETHWDAEDALFAPLEGAGGRRFGIISVDEPASGRRPDDDQLALLGGLAANASLAIESARQVAALEAALARNRAVVSSTLEAVIAADLDDRVVEFNPAAERTFGYRAVEVLGRNGAELFVPPAARETYRRNAARVRAEPHSTLLGRRIETTAMRKDGTEFRVELTLARVDGDDEQGPVFYSFVRDIEDRLRSQEQLAHLAYHDALTGLPNRSMVEQQLDLSLARARRSDEAVALMFVDLDDFKEVNDRLGHAAGDRLLTAVSNRLRAVLRDSDILARQGGDEFLVLLSDLGDGAATAAEQVGIKLLDTLREPFVIAGTEVRTGASIGISLYPDDAADTEGLLRHADAAMYRAKSAGGGRFVFHQRPETAGARSASIAAQLRRAIEQGELELQYQPIWRLGEPHELAVLEGLVRWRHPDRGLLAPESFINLADQSTAGDELVSWVAGEAGHQLRTWQAAGPAPMVAINVSSHQLLAPGFADRLHAQLRAGGVAPSSLALELTESAWMVDAGATLEVVDVLRSIGFAVALDDFGAGYSSLSRLPGLAFDAIKIDGRLLQGVPGDGQATALFAAVVKLAAVCGGAIIAEGVESDAQLEVLRGCGITHAQGFRLGGPMDVAAATELLSRATVRLPSGSGGGA